MKYAMNIELTLQIALLSIYACNIILNHAILFS